MTANRFDLASMLEFLTLTIQSAIGKFTLPILAIRFLLRILPNMLLSSRQRLHTSTKPHISSDILDTCILSIFLNALESPLLISEGNRNHFTFSNVDIYA